MSKIICDVCGTSYPETATQCPICGCIRSVDARIVSGNTSDVEEETTRVYNYVKGGRFSKSNVKKRNNGKLPPPIEIPEQSQEAAQESGKKETGVIITTLIVLLLIIAVVAYIVIRFFLPNLSEKKPADNGKDNGKDGGYTVSDTVNTDDDAFAAIPCEQVVLSPNSITFKDVNEVQLLNATRYPDVTTDSLVYTSSNEAVAVVDKNGCVTSVGGGEAVITVTCGSAKAECKVVCNIPTPEEETTEETISADQLKLNREDFTLGYKGETHKLYDGDIPVDAITWTSSNDQIATIKNGVVTAVGPSGNDYAVVYAEYGGVKVSCIVRCSW